MAEDFWALPCLVALYTLPANPNPWAYYVWVIFVLVMCSPHPNFHADAIGSCNCVTIISICKFYYFIFRCCVTSSTNDLFSDTCHSYVFPFHSESFANLVAKKRAEVAWCSRNAGAVACRTVNASLYNMFVQASSIISSQIYVASDAPRCKFSAFEVYSQTDLIGTCACDVASDLRGNRNLIIICCINLFILYPGTRWYYKLKNAQRDKKWNAMSIEVRELALFLALLNSMTSTSGENTLSCNDEGFG